MRLLEPQRVFKIIKFFMAVAFFTAIFIAFLNSDLWDFDFWWHIATGKYIVSTSSLPDKDPFSYTSALEENKNQFPERENFILKQYWLSQAIFYLIYEYSGPKGIILLRSGLLVATIILVFWRLQRWSVSFPVSFIFAFVSFMELKWSIGERPVLFTILFAVLSFFILEDFKDRKSKIIFLLVPIMILWANMHGGFILGIVIIAVFMLGEGIKIILRKSVYSKHEIILFYSAATLSLMSSFINPTGWDAFSITFSPEYKYFTENVHEYSQPLLLYKKKYEYVFLTLLFPVILILRNKRLDLSHAILLSGSLIMSISALRFVVYYVVIGAMIMGRESDILIRDLLRTRFSEKVYNRILTLLTAAAFFSIMLFVTGFLEFKNVKFDIARDFSVPAGAVDFVEKNRLKGNVFNYHAYGGYISWRLYPSKKNFADTRALNLTVNLESVWIESGIDSVEGVKTSNAKVPLWNALLNHYNVNLVLLPTIDMLGQIPPLTFKISESDNWVSVYCDLTSIVFIRNAEQNGDIIKKFRLSKDYVYHKLIYVGAINALSNKINPRYLISLGEIFYKMGRLNDAATAYRYALKRMPENQAIKEGLAKIESELK